MSATPYLSSPLCLSALVLLTLTPLLWAAVLLFFLLAGRSMWHSWSTRERSHRERNEWGAPRPSLSQRWTMKMGRIRFRLPELAKRRTRMIPPKTTPPAPSTATAEPLKKPIKPVLPFFEAPSGKPKEAFVWNETKEID